MPRGRLIFLTFSSQKHLGQFLKRFSAEGDSVLLFAIVSLGNLTESLYLCQEGQSTVYKNPEKRGTMNGKRVVWHLRFQFAALSALFAIAISRERILRMIKIRQELRLFQKLLGIDTFKAELYNKI